MANGPGGRNSCLGTRTYRATGAGKIQGAFEGLDPLFAVGNSQLVHQEHAEQRVHAAKQRQLRQFRRRMRKDIGR